MTNPNPRKPVAHTDNALSRARMKAGLTQHALGHAAWQNGTITSSRISKIERQGWCSPWQARAIDKVLDGVIFDWRSPNDRAWILP